LDNVKYDSKTSFIGVNLNSINFNLTALLEELAVSQQNRILEIKK